MRLRLELAVSLSLTALTAVLLLARTGALRPIVTWLALPLPAPLLFGLLAAVRLVSLLSGVLLLLLAALPLLAALALLTVLFRPLGSVLSAPALLSTAVLLAGAALLSVRPARLTAVLEVRFGARVRPEAALIAVLSLALTSFLALALTLTAALVFRLPSRFAVALVPVPLPPTGAAALTRLRSRPSTHAGLVSRLLSLFGPPRAGRFLPPISLLALLLGSTASHFAATTRRALEPTAVSVALALVALAILVVLVALVVVPVRSVLP